MNNTEPGHITSKPVILQPKRFRSIRTRLIFYFFLLFSAIITLIMLTTIVGIPYTPAIGEWGQEKAEALSGLNLIADIKKERLVSWIKERVNDAYDIAANGALGSDFMQLHNEFHQTAANGKLNAQFWEHIRSEDSYKNITGYLNAVKSRYGIYYKIKLINIEDNLIIVSTNNSDLGLKNPHEPCNLHTAPPSEECIEDITLDRSQHIPVFNIHHLLRDKDGKPIGILVLEINIDDIVRPMLHTGSGLGKQGEVLLVNKDALLLTSLKHPLPDGTVVQPLKYQLKTNAARLAARGREGLIEAEDYRGVPVLAAYRHIPVTPEWGWGMIVKRDKAELFAPLWHNIRFTLLIGLVCFFIFISLSVILAGKFTRPVISLSRIANEVAQGDLGVRAQVNEQDEVGDLAAAFNFMIGRIQNWHKELEQNVQDRTAELNSSYRLLEITSRHIEMSPLLGEFVAEVKGLTGCTAAGIRMLDKDGNIPYAAYEGFSKDFYDKECWLSVNRDQCMCINVVIGKTDSRLSFYTKGGSFYSNNLQILVDSFSEEEMRNIRGVCVKAGYKSMALIPFYQGERILGLIHVADYRENLLPLKIIEVLEKAALQLSTAIQRISAEEELRRARQELEQRVEERTVELKATHEQLLHAEKLSALGKLAASIAHEFNNPIYGIKMILEDIGNKPGLSENDKKSIELAVKETTRVSHLVYNLQDFYRPSSGVVTPVDLHQSIDEVLEICAKKLKVSGVRVARNFAANVPEVPAVADQLKQVFLNIITNAEEAMLPAGGTLTIQTRLDGNKVNIVFRDTGSGIAPDIMDKIFDPFFTTKKAVSGTGLGLSVSYGIIKKHRGDILVESVPNDGSTFTVVLPVKDGH